MTDHPRTDPEELVERAVEAWHASNQSLHEWLGWTWAEYEAWVADPKAIPRPPKFFSTVTLPDQEALLKAERERE